jgi:hypothetical protein
MVYLCLLLKYQVKSGWMACDLHRADYRKRRVEFARRQPSERETSQGRATGKHAVAPTIYEVHGSNREEVRRAGGVLGRSPARSLFASPLFDPTQMEGGGYLSVFRRFFGRSLSFRLVSVEVLHSSGLVGLPGSSTSLLPPSGIAVSIPRRVVSLVRWLPGPTHDGRQ